MPPEKFEQPMYVIFPRAIKTAAAAKRGSAKAERRHPQTGRTELSKLHCRPPSWRTVPLAVLRLSGQ